MSLMFYLPMDRVKVMKETMLSISDKDGESSSKNESKGRGCWKILIVDDDEDVHLSTEYALKNTLIANRALDLIHCYTATQALESLKRHENVAVAVIDVVMESPDAGLKLIEDIRSLDKHGNMRIVLRTGQPGFAPEISVITQYDINAYVNKSTLTKTRLLSTLITAIRSYHQLEIIHRSRQGLEIVVGSTVDLFNRSNLSLLAQGILTQLMALLGGDTHGFVSIYNPSLHMQAMTSTALADSLPFFRVLVATERYEKFIDSTLENADIENLRNVFEAAISDTPTKPVQKELGLHFLSRQGTRLFVFIDSWHEPFPNFVSLLKIFSNNISVVFDNLTLIEKLDNLAFEDPVHHLPNRNAFEIAYTNLQENNVEFVFIRVRLESLDKHFSAFGQEITDKAVEDIKERLDKNLSIKPYFIGFDGNSDFFILTPILFNPQEINKIAQSTISFGDIELQIAVKIALVRPLTSTSSKDALRRSIATILQYQGRIIDSNIMAYSSEMSDGIAHRLALNSQLNNAIDLEEGIEVHFQPKISLPDRNIMGAEALCRWLHEGKPVRPDIFIALAEQSGLINKLTDLIIKLTGQFVRARSAQGLTTPPIAINLSIHDLRQVDSANKLHRKFLNVGLNNTVLELEVTESCMIEDTFHVIEQLESLRNLGYKIALDDFGTGYSSLGRLNTLPIDYVKMDKVFIDDLTPLNVNESIVALALSISSTMGFKLIAEGVETKEQEEALIAIGCHMYQGYLFSKPLPAAEFNNFLSSYSSSKL